MSTTVFIRTVHVVERIRGGVMVKLNWLDLDEVIAVLGHAEVAELHAKLTPLVRKPQTPAPSEHDTCPPLMGAGGAGLSSEPHANSKELPCPSSD